MKYPLNVDKNTDLRIGKKGKNMLPSVDQNFGMSPLRGNNRKILDLVQEEVFHHNILQEY